MAERRRFVIEPASSGQVISLGAEESAHILRVLRLRGGECVEGVDGRGWVYDLKLCRPSGKKARVEVVGKDRAPRSRPLNAIVAAGLIKGSRMDWAVEKAAELGARAFIPFVSERTVATPESKGMKVQRWRRIAKVAMKQSFSPFLMRVCAPRGFEYVAKLTRTVPLTFVGGAGAPPLRLSGAEKTSGSACLLVIGPEGGLSADECSLLRGEGVKFFTLGPDRLRSETAVVTGLAALWQACS